MSVSKLHYISEMVVAVVRALPTRSMEVAEIDKRVHHAERDFPKQPPLTYIPTHPS
jgi:hypothetical protein